jgi:formylglycine-generating enzyme required for sulfatase activity
VYIPPGSFMMGTEDAEIERLVKKVNWDGVRREKPQHQVTIPTFYMGKHPITQAQWKAVAALPQIKRELKAEPSNFKGDNRPVEQISWYDAVEFCARLSKHTGKQYRLPSEAEWEYACRAETTTPFHFGETITSKLANYNASNTFAEEAKGEYRQQTTPVKQFPANAFGLYDMHGNVWEWCLDDWHDDYQGAPKDGTPWFNDKNDNLSQKKGNVVLRGGFWGNYPENCRSASRSLNYRAERDFFSDFVGFRVVCAVGEEPEPIRAIW